MVLNVIDSINYKKLQHQFEPFIFSFLEVSTCFAAAIINQTIPKLNWRGSLNAIPRMIKIMPRAENGRVLLKSFIQLCFGLLKKTAFSIIIRKPILKII